MHKGIFTTIREAKEKALEFSKTTPCVVVDIGAERDCAAFAVMEENEVIENPPQEWYRILSRFEDGVEDL